MHIGRNTVSSRIRRYFQKKKIYFTSVRRACRTSIDCLPPADRKFPHCSTTAKYLFTLFLRHTLIPHTLCMNRQSMEYYTCDGILRKISFFVKRSVMSTWTTAAIVIVSTMSDICNIAHANKLLLFYCTALYEAHGKLSINRCAFEKRIGNIFAAPLYSIHSTFVSIVCSLFEWHDFVLLAWQRK